MADFLEKPLCLKSCAFGGGVLVYFVMCMLHFSVWLLPWAGLSCKREILISMGLQGKIKVKNALTTP